MRELPDRIWAVEDFYGENEWQEVWTRKREKGWTEYVRGDLVLRAGFTGIMGFIVGTGFGYLLGVYL